MPKQLNRFLIHAAFGLEMLLIPVLFLSDVLFQQLTVFRNTWSEVRWHVKNSYKTYKNTLKVLDIG